MIRGILDFMQVNIGFGFDVQAKQALKYFESKGLKPSFSFADVTAQEHATAFTVAKMMDMDLLKDVQDSLYAAMTEGLSYQQWSERIIPTLQANGWWGRQPVYDPLTGKTVVSELGSSRRLQTIFRTNMQSAYAVGHWQQIMAQAKDAPYLLYDAIDDFRTRPKHRAWDNTVLPITDPFWTAHTPPNGWGCRCSVIQLSADDLDAMGLKVSDSPKIKYVDWKNPRTGKVERTPDGVDAGFGFNAGQARYEQLKRISSEKAAAILDPDMRDAAQRGVASVAETVNTPNAAKPLTKTEIIDQIVEAAKLDVADDIQVTIAVKPEGLKEVFDAIRETSNRFGLGKLQYVGDPLKGAVKYKLPRNAVAGYAPRTDSMIFRSGYTDVANADINLENELTAAKDIRKSWELIGPFLRRLGHTEVADVAATLSGAQMWSVSPAIKAVTYHEMGHRLHNLFNAELDAIAIAGYSQKWAELLSTYAATSKEEMMAEAFALYMIGSPIDHQRIYPPLLTWFKRHDRSQK
jgi:SPP1 gp7 family putative phage head morphogenesis protein